jgi:hypothetical protein
MEKSRDEPPNSSSRRWPVPLRRRARQITRAKIDELRVIEKQIASMIQHENELTNHRIQWFLTLQGFLFTSVALYGDQPGRNLFGYLIGIMGIGVCISFGVALRAGQKGFDNLVERWHKAYEAHRRDYYQAGVAGYISMNKWENRLVPWVALPWILGFGWILICIFVFLHPGHDLPGTYTPVVLEKNQKSATQHDHGMESESKSSEKEIRVYNTRTGLRKE